MTSDGPAADNMSIEDYLAQGGKLTSPDNPPPRYRAELLRMMSSFVDSELAGSAGFASSINWAPGIKERIAASRIVLEKADHAERVLDLMGDFGTDKTRYNQLHDWAARSPRAARHDPQRRGSDMRLSVFHYPFEDWTDAVVMNVLMGLATVHQLGEMSQCSYTPLAEVMRQILPREQRHMELGLEGLERIVGDPGGLQRAKACVDYWYPRVAETFGSAGSERFQRLARMGLRRTANEDLQAAWAEAANKQLVRLQLA
ncbi:MAG TPA: Phenylacetic acid catabolic protein [Salinisphaeraceae bacterium]|nr:Phenylacetic acid catabolic protein [Salinisphaeraceae bacterium]